MKKKQALCDSLKVRQSLCIKCESDWFGNK